MDCINAFGDPPTRSNLGRHLEHARSAPCALERFDSLGKRHVVEKKIKQNLRQGNCSARWVAINSQNRGSSQNGSVALGIILFWLPIFALFGLILWLRAHATQHLLQQRALDRCLYPVIAQRCDTLSHLSETNARLRQMVLVIAAIEAVKTATSAIPFVGGGMVAAGESTAAVLRVMVTALAHTQNSLITKEKIATAAGTLKCGLPMPQSSELKFSRPQTPSSIIAKATPPLSWREGAAGSELSLRKWSNFQLQTYAHCFTDVSTEDGNLDGEHYQTSFRHAPAKRLSRPSLPSQQF